MQARSARPLITLVISGTDVQKQNAAWALGNLAGSQYVCIKIGELGGLPPLIGLVGCGTGEQKETAAPAVGEEDEHMCFTGDLEL